LIALTAAAIIATASPAAASTAEEFLNAPVWYLEYEVSLKSTSSGSEDLEVGKLSFTANLERVFAGAAELNLRSGGPGPIAMGELLGGSAGATPSAADAMKINEKLMSVMDHTANWMVAGNALDENATDPTAGMMGSARPARIDYKRVDTSKGLLDDDGRELDRTVTTTIKGTGKVLGGGFGGIILEMNTAEKSLILTLPLGFAVQEGSAVEEIVEVLHPKGSAPVETRKTEDVPLDRVPQGLVLDDASTSKAAGAVTVRGVLDPSTGKISGEQSFKVRYDEVLRTKAPGTALVKYTLTMTPPEK
jgi:hypothetical protein